MTRRERKEKDRRKNVVVFLDVNVSPATSTYLENLRGCAHWISLDAFQCFLEERGGRDRYSEIRRQKIRDFFDWTGDVNVFEIKENPPYKMKDDELFSYMARLIEERYPGRLLYLFYTHDKKFFTQPLMQNHPRLSLFTSGQLVYIALDTPVERGRAVGEAACAIRKDFSERLERL